MDLNLRGKVAVITGGAKGIGKEIVNAFKQEGAKTAIIDILDNPYFVGDISSKEVLERFSERVLEDFGSVDFLINNAKPGFIGIESCSYEEFQKALSVGVSAPFYLAKLFKEHFNEGGSIINIGSTRAFMSQPQSESYSAAKGGITALTHSLAMSLAPKIRVNSISPGWINTDGYIESKEDRYQQPVGRVGRVQDIANAVLFLCSDKSSFITGENITVDGGMSRQMIYDGENGWDFNLE